MRLDPITYRVDGAQWLASPNCDERDSAGQPEVILLHCISLPPGEYGGGQIARFFCNNLAPNEHPYFQGMAHLTVSSHFLIERSGHLLQFVATNKRAWHAGESVCFERPKVNDFSIGIELEGWDEDAHGYTNQQYHKLAELTACLQSFYPAIKRHGIFAHSDVAPGRKPDPGPFFDWLRYLKLLDEMSI